MRPAPFEHVQPGRRGAAVRCVIDCGGLYLLAVHSNYRAETIGKWGLPGGHLEPGERPALAAAREIEEEFALHVPSWRPLTHFLHRDRRQFVVAATVARVGELTVDAGEILRHGWFTQAELDRLAADERLHVGNEAELTTLAVS